MMTWEETILYARKQEEFSKLIEESYLNEDLRGNCVRYFNGNEFSEINKKIWKHTGGKALKILDIGAGNGISSYAFAQSANNEVWALEPDPGEITGREAISRVIEIFGLRNLHVIDSYAEKTTFEDNFFDLVFARQAMHHAADLKQFLIESSRVLKPGGILFTVRDHVITSNQNLQDFLDLHPLHKFYGGENAFTLEEYHSAFLNAGLQIKEELGPLDSLINYEPRSANDMADEFRRIFKNKYKLPLLNVVTDKLCIKLYKLATDNFASLQGRLYSFIAIKKSRPGFRLN